ncbi:hypothetical protein [Zoogloea sp.]|uniref:Y-family DNA polymerase n=1 Tax=Zoogloea sp. TaxID=49181 RepID=UPI0025F565B8|nr:hypothetical protein [Zoogloea sp.]
MGARWFQLQELARARGILAFSNNYALYADMSSRVARVLADFTPAIEIYSIDESFLSLEGLTAPPLEIGRQIRERVARAAALIAAMDQINERWGGAFGRWPPASVVTGG